MNNPNSIPPVKELTWSQQVVFALYLCERMLPNYEFFHQITAFGDPKPLQGTLNACWDWVWQPKAQKVNFARWQEKVDEVTPSEHGHDMLGVYPAMDACTAVSILLQGLLDKSSDNLEDVARVSQASVVKFIELNESEDVPQGQLEQHVQNHELFEYEMAMQHAMFDFLAAQPTDNGSELKQSVLKQVVLQVRQMLTDEGVSNLGIQLDD